MFSSFPSNQLLPRPSSVITPHVTLSAAAPTGSSLQAAKSTEEGISCTATPAVTQVRGPLASGAVLLVPFYTPADAIRQETPFASNTVLPTPLRTKIIAIARITASLLVFLLEVQSCMLR